MVIQQYQDPQVKKYLGWGYWFFSRKEQIYKIGKALLLVFVILLWLYLALQIFIYFSSPTSDELAGQIIMARADWEARRADRAPQPLVVSEAHVLPRVGNLADFLALAENPNQKWSLTIDYYFSWPDGQTVSQRAKILPGETRALAIFGATVNSAPTSAEFNFKISEKRRIKNPATLRFLGEITGSVKTGAAAVQNQGNSTLATITIVNQSIYNILGPKFVVILKSPAGPLAAGLASADVIKTQASADLQYRWLEAYPANLQAEAYPDFDWLDLSAYRLESGGEIRF